MTPDATGYDLALIYIYQIALEAGANDADIALWLDTPAFDLPGHVSPGLLLQKQAQRVIELAEMTFLKTLPGNVTRLNEGATAAMQP